MTPEQIAAQLAKRQRDGVVRGNVWRRMKEAEAAREAVPLRRLTPAQRAALVLNAHALGMFNDHNDVARRVDEIAGRVLSPAERRALKLIIRRAAGRLILGAFEETGNDGAGGGGVNQLWTVRDGERVYVAWVYRKGSALSARVTGPRRPDAAQRRPAGRCSSPSCCSMQRARRSSAGAAAPGTAGLTASVTVKRGKSCAREVGLSAATDTAERVRSSASPN